MKTKYQFQNGTAMRAFELYFIFTIVYQIRSNYRYHPDKIFQSEIEYCFTLEYGAACLSFSGVSIDYIDFDEYFIMMHCVREKLKNYTLYTRL